MTHTIPTPAGAVQPVLTQLILDGLPGLVGALNHTLVDITGTKVPFILVAFADNRAMHATNMDPAMVGPALTELMKNWGTGSDDIGEQNAAG